MCQLSSRYNGDSIHLHHSRVLVIEAISIRERVLRALALNRTPGYHFAGNFLGFSFEQVSEPRVRMSMAVGPHVTELNGTVNYGALAVFADIAMAANVRAGHTPATRLATVQMNLQFTGAPTTDRLHAESIMQGYLEHISSRQGAAQVIVTSHGKPVCYGMGTFMVLDPPKGVALYNMALRKDSDSAVAPLTENELKRDERKVLALADAAIVRAHAGEAFIHGFLGVNTRALEKGATGSLKNGPHVGNRVGHLQGGVTMGLGIATAEAALPASWRLSAVTAWYIRPGEGRVIKARSKIIHHGRLTAVVRTEITGKNKRRVMEMVTTHAHKAA
jgi:acyl-coenzyme A thioesterase PaaI-like protein